LARDRLPHIPQTGLAGSRSCSWLSLSLSPTKGFASQGLKPNRSFELSFIRLIYLLDIGIISFVIIDLKVKTESEWVVG